jgi:hypothetical protein
MAHSFGLNKVINVRLYLQSEALHLSTLGFSLLKNVPAEFTDVKPLSALRVQ